MNDFRGNSLAVWYLENPLEPRLVGRVKLEASNRRCLLELDDEWRRSGFPLSPDLTHDMKVHAPLKDMVAPGAVEDAMPDRWGERMIRVVSRPSRMSPLDKLWYAGDRRFGALGMSSSIEEYRPVDEQPLMSVDSLQEAEALIARVLDREPLSERERQLIASAGSMGGVHPKMLIENDGEEWIAKFPRGSNVDQLPKSYDDIVDHCFDAGSLSVGVRFVELRHCFNLPVDVLRVGACQIGFWPFPITCYYIAPDRRWLRKLGCSSRCSRNAQASIWPLR
ncbi:hypothetical protein C6558_32065 [Ensifer sp. NM-2]|uniref:HipA N-terminal domain-containing protein n=1 Tax=Ensifer sp. NM-2 TaxID=2109730 RepID=UPI000D13DD89|nr:HipA N-terminal domain-containing protein [Ensifer sp. NM-2]PSS60617.1 hypothetical protein C6558_32065 [Ensifer sp. NM-2]